MHSAPRAHSPFYNHAKNQAWVFRGKSTDKKYIQTRFRLILCLVFVFEVFAVVWPITATVIYGVEAVLAWFWFIYVVRVLLLWYPFVVYEDVILLAGAGGYKGWLHQMRIPAAFRPCTTLWLWALLSLIVCGLFGSLITVATVAAFPLFTSTLLYGLSIGFSALFTIESMGAVFLLYWRGVWTPIATSPPTRGNK